jgi:mono/diheme cytochrome c family protein
MPRWVVLALVLLAAFWLIPFACVAAARGSLSPRPRIQLFRDMGNQGRFKSQQRNPLFADGRAARLPVPGTVARDRLDENEGLTSGKSEGRWVTAIPVPVTESLLGRGQERFGIYCAPCHGLAGYGDGIVAKRADRLQEGTWVPPLSFHADAVRARTAGEIFDTISHGIRTMPAYGPQIPVEDRWAIVGYVRALQRSQNARIEDVPQDVRSGLR